MKLVKIAAGVLNQTPLDWTGNLENILAAMEQARQHNVSILCLPELCITGYGCEDAFHSPGVEKTAHDMLLAVADAAHDLVVSVGLPLSYAGGLFNTAGLIVDRRIVGFVGKQHLAGDGIHYEPRWFKRWPEAIAGEVEIDDTTYPIGDLIFEVGDVRIGFEICEDAWVASRPGARHAARGADIILNPSASHFAFGKHHVRQGFVREGSRAFNVSYVYANLVGNESGRVIYDGDAMIACNGELVALGRRLSFEDVTLTTSIIDIDVTRMARARTGSFEPELNGDESDVIDVEFEWPVCELESNNLHRDAWEESPDLKHEEFTRSVTLALFDYMRKSHSRGFIVSLSGGVDSTAVAVLVSIMVRMAIRELGMERFRDKAGDIFDHLPETVDEVVRALLTTVYQATRNSSATTRDAAAEVARAISADHLYFDVDSLVQDYVTMVEQAMGRELTWQQDDLALQNIQARVRSPGVWMLANIRNALLLSTSNRSESAVGYATMDGDTSGGLAPIAGIDKAYLRTWLEWIERTGPDGIGSIPAVRCVNVQVPTAELRPADSHQTDEGDLMPYVILDTIERLAIRDKLMPVEVHEHLQADYPDIEPLQLGQWTIRFFQLWSRNQWKRERFAPSFHLDDKNLDPKTWCRFPILSGGYEYELEKLRDKLACLSSG